MVAWAFVGAVYISCFFILMILSVYIIEDALKWCRRPRYKCREILALNKQEAAWRSKKNIEPKPSGICIIYSEVFEMRRSLDRRNNKLWIIHLILWFWFVNKSLKKILFQRGTPSQMESRESKRGPKTEK